MVIVLGTVEVDPARREDFLAAQAKEAADSQAERGCVEWSMLVDPDRPDIVRLLEVWTDVDSFEAHLEVLTERRPAMMARMAEIGVFEVRSADYTRQDVATSTPMSA